MAAGARFWAPLAVDYGSYDPLRAGSIDGTDTHPHDRAVVRALEAKYKPNRLVSGDPRRTVFVGRLSHSTTPDSLRGLFSEHGEVESCRVVRDIVTGRSKGYAFVEYKHLRDAEKACYRCHKQFLDGAQLLVEMEYERVLPGWVPRRLGGGLGGKKESGQLRFGGKDRPFKKPIVLDSKMLNARRGGGRERWQEERGRREERMSGGLKRERSRSPHRRRSREQ